MRTTLVVLLSILMLLSSCLILLMPNALATDEYKFSVNVKINDDTTNRDQGSPDIVVTSNGNVGVVWMDGRDDAVKFDIYFSKSTDSCFSSHGFSSGGNYSFFLVSCGFIINIGLVTPCKRLAATLP